MKLTDKRFWIVWAIAELLLLASCIDSALRSQSLGMMCIFAVTQPLMITLALLKFSHRNGALVNLIIVSLYSIYSIYLRLSDEDPEGWAWFVFTVVVPIVQYVIVLLYWGLAKLAEVARHKEGLSK